ncbi:MAG: hypothetical protein KDA33_07365, partial [Phycisphaerales bacterium]|nr:hypothetical protein [Phycisphaerales bacterium]
MKIPNQFARWLVFLHAFLMGGVVVAEDCNNNGVPDDDEVAGYQFVDTSPFLNFTIPEGLVAHVVPAPPDAASIVEIEIISQFSAPGDVVFAINGSNVAIQNWSGDSSCGLHQTTLQIDAAEFNALTDPSSSDGAATYLMEING